MKVLTVLFMLVLVAVLSLSKGWGAAPALAQEGLRVTATSVENRFPEGVSFRLEAQGASPIKSITLYYNLGGLPARLYAYLDFEKGTSVKAEYLLRTKGDRYVPPGTEIRYSYVLEDSSGGKLETPEESFLLLDARFPWEEVKEGQVSVYYYGPSKGRAQEVLKTVGETIAKMGPVLGTSLKSPVKLLVYNNYRDMQGALPFTSEALQRSLITEGQAWTEHGVLLILGGDPGVRGTVSHEMTHFMLRQATGRPLSPIPVWLDEGLAEYGNLQPTFGYDQALQDGLRKGRLLPLASLMGRPGKADDVMLFYGEARSVVRFMIDSYGAEKLQTLIQGLKRGNTLDGALREAYGFDLMELEARWRMSIGAPPLAAQDLVALATPTFPPTMAPYGFATTPVPTMTPPPTQAGPAAGGPGCRLGAGPSEGLDLGYLGLPVLLAALAVLGRRRG
ncbi:MAG: peptidase MA family metallohydrolase [Chloroflexota bacterium]|nr:peptidase MA family metallohydrolase [Chloroflexota bacterium]